MSTDSPVSELEEAAAALSALGNPTRLRIFRLLVRAGREGLIVGDIARLVEVPGSTLAHHLRALAGAGLVDQQRQGREVLCVASYPAMERLLAFLTQECCRGIPRESLRRAVGLTE